MTDNELALCFIMSNIMKNNDPSEKSLQALRSACRDADEEFVSKLLLQLALWAERELNNDTRMARQYFL
jgi:hypothetical protein